MPDRGDPMQGPTALTRDNALQYLLSPTDESEFFARFYEQRMLHVARNSTTYYAGVLDLDDVDRILASNTFRTSDLGVINARAKVEAAEYVSANDVIDVGKVLALYERGASLLLVGMHRYHEPLTDLCAGLERTFGATVGANVYVTPFREQGFGPHFDTHDVLAIQLRGTKRWRIYGSPIELPVTAHGTKAPPYPPGTPSSDVDLQPGDTLYLPRGFVHDPECISGTSIHVSIHVLSFIWAELLREALLLEVFNHPMFRRAVPRSLLSSSPGAEAAAQLREFVRTFADRADFDGARKVLGQRLAARRVAGGLRGRFVSIANRSTTG